MGEYETLFAIALGMGTLFWLVGAGAGDFVDFQAEGVNLSSGDVLDQRLSEYVVDRSTSGDATDFVFYEPSIDAMRVNETAWNDSGAVEAPRVRYSGFPDEVDEINITVDFQDSSYSGNDSEAIQYCSSWNCEALTQGENNFEYNGDYIEVSWIQPGVGLDYRIDENIYLYEVEGIVNNDDSTFVTNLRRFFSADSGYGFFNTVILTALTLVGAALLIQVAGRGVPLLG